MTPNPDPSDWLKPLTGAYKGIRFARGVVGKTSHAMLAIIGLWAVVVWRFSEKSLYFDVGLGVVAFVATAVFIWWTHSTQTFAAKNPAQAILEGAELLQYQRFEAQLKGYPQIIDVEPVADPQDSSGSPPDDPEGNDA